MHCRKLSTTLGAPNLTLCVDPKLLLGILGDPLLEKIDNPRQRLLNEKHYAGGSMFYIQLVNVHSWEEQVLSLEPD